MKKWWIGFAILLLALLSSSAMAEDISFGFCDRCNQMRVFVFVRMQYSSPEYHVKIIKCTTCSSEKESDQISHTASIAATCDTQAYCNACNSYYGNPLSHNWGGWNRYDDTYHFRNCRSCGKQSFQGHVPGIAATCTTRPLCWDCGGFYGSVDKNNHSHWSILTYYEYEGYAGDMHRVRIVCSGCGGTLRYFYEKHNWNEWEKYDENKHHRDCKYCKLNQYEQHDSTGTGLCTGAKCTVCKAFVTPSGPVEHERGERILYRYVSETEHEKERQCYWCHATLGITRENHSLVLKKTTPPTCTESGTDVFSCKYPDCGYTTSVERPPAHDLVQYDAQAPTCTEAGWDAYEACRRTGCGYTTYVEKPPVHDLVQYDAQAPTCTEVGWNAYEACKNCTYTTYSALDVNPNNHVGTPTTTYVKTSETQHTAKITYSVCKHTVDGESTDHTETTPATCTAAAYCAVCESSYGEADPDAHDLESHDAKEATCTAIGWDAYETCSRCDYTTYVEKSALGHDRVSHDAKAPTCTEIGWDAYDTCSRCDYSTYVEKSALGHDYAAKTTKPTCTEKGYTTHTCTRCQDSYQDEIVSARGHWYGEWMPNADGTNSASCLRDAYEHTVDCVRFSFVLAAEDVRTEFVLCPVCGEVSEIRLIDENGEVVETREAVRLLLVEDAKAEALTKRLPRGELVVRMGALESGEQLMSVAFEIGGKLTQPTGQVKITLPAGLLEGYALCLLSEDVAETELTLDVKEDTVSFVIDYTDSLDTVKVLHLVPAV